MLVLAGKQHRLVSGCGWGGAVKWGDGGGDIAAGDGEEKEQRTAWA